MLEVGKKYSHDDLNASGFYLVAENHSDTISVYNKLGDYYVFRAGILRHPNIDAEGAIRSLTQYVK